jgi:hypothetical protein
MRAESRISEANAGGFASTDISFSMINKHFLPDD